MGVAGCDVDDGLTLLFLLGCRNVDLLGVTCAYGNSTQEVVYNNTIRLLKEWGREDIPVFRGADNSTDRLSDAAIFMAKAGEMHCGELSIIATGSLTNLYGAFEYDNKFYDNIRSISIMGGYTSDLLVGGKVMDELNMSCDSIASLETLRRGHDIRIATGQNSLESYFRRDEFDSYLDEKGGPLASYLKDALDYWFDFYEKEWNCPGFVNWDVMAAVQLLYPEYMRQVVDVINPDEESLKRGRLLGDGINIEVCLPEIKNHDEYFNLVYDTWFGAEISLN